MAFHADHLTLTQSAGADRRAALFRENLADMAERWTLGLAWSLMPSRIGGLPALWRLCFDELLAPDYALPDPERALENPPGLAGIVHDLTLPTLLAAYRRGLYPWAHIAPLKWWSPPQRSVLFFKNVHISNNLARLMRQDRYTVTFDRDFEAVIAGCAGRRQGRWHLTWITPRIMRVYAEAFDAGHAHSFEVWNEAGKLVGGGYGLASGASFTSESQFALESNASRIGMTVLNWHLDHWGFRYNDGKLIGPLWQNMGFREIPRRDFLARLAEAVRLPAKTGRWQVEADLDTVSHWQPQTGCGD
ncbi:MAG: leucyl/phenylalanyl-tRNA--protein transferase [Rhizobiales bacterium]|nr:leucyl/phenylalanyl-tRNA--protein transferase [Hyphomicrobiales bacterium]